MTPRTLLDAFSTLADAPGGIGRLRELVLQFAVRGKLVAQDPDDEPAGLLLERIAEEKARLVREKKIRKPKALPPVDEGELPFEVPEGWAWCRLGWISLQVHYGLTASAAHQERRNRFLRITDIQDNRVNWATVPGCDLKAGQRKKYALADGDIVIARTGGTVGKTYLVEGLGDLAAVFASYLIRVAPPQGTSRYLKRALESPLYWKQLMGKTAGTGQPNVNATALSSLVVPLPPLAEQHRIVARVDALMALLDRLEAAQGSRDTTRATLRDAALLDLRDAATSDAAATAWDRIAQHMDDLFTDPADVAPLRQAILQLAVRGRLVEQDADAEDGPAEEKLVKDLLKFQNGYAFKSTWYLPDGVRVVRNQNVGHGTVDWAKPKRVSAERAEEFKRFALDEGDIVLSLDRPLITTGLKVARVRAVDLPCLLLQRVARPVLRSGALDLDYLYVWLRSPEFTDTIDPGRSNGVPHISTREVEAMRIRLPAIPEQHRIVAKVDALMALCDQLEDRLRAAQDRSASFATAAVHHLDT